MDNGNVFVCDGTTYPTCNYPTGNYRTSRAQSETHVIQSVTPAVGSAGTYTVTLTDGIILPTWGSGISPGAWWPDNFVHDDGVENLDLQNTSITSGNHNNIAFFWCENCWATGNRIVRTLNAGVNIYTSSHVTVANNYAVQTSSQASAGYGFIETQSSEDLIVNNIGQNITAPFTQDGPASGSVIAYNFSTNDAYYDPTYLLCSDEPHSAGDMMNLYEGNEGLCFNADNIHGSEDLQTLFRNYYTGQATGRITNGPPSPVQFFQFQRYPNIIGNVLGYSSAQTGTYQTTNLASCTSFPSLGSGNPVYFIAGCLPYSAYDPVVASSMFRWGNCDITNIACQFNGSEVPTGIAVLPNTVPVSHALPNSYYYSSQPSFWATTWGTPPWPPIGPDISGGIGPGGHANHIPAELVFANEAIDPAFTSSYSVTGTPSCSSTATGNLVTLAVSITGYYPSGWAIVSGITPSGYNGTYNFTGTFSGTNLTSMSYYVPSCPGSYVSGGTVAWAQIRAFNPKDYSSAGISISPSSLPGATVNDPYSQTVTASGGSGPYTYSISSGSLSGCNLSLGPSTGEITGTPLSLTTCTFTVTATDSLSNAGSQPYSITTQSQPQASAPVCFPSSAAPPVVVVCTSNAPVICFSTTTTPSTNTSTGCTVGTLYFNSISVSVDPTTLHVVAGGRRSPTTPGFIDSPVSVFTYQSGAPVTGLPTPNPIGVVY